MKKSIMKKYTEFLENVDNDNDNKPLIDEDVNKLEDINKMDKDEINTLCDLIKGLDKEYLEKVADRYHIRNEETSNWESDYDSYNDYLCDILYKQWEVGGVS